MSDCKPFIKVTVIVIISALINLIILPSCSPADVKILCEVNTYISRYNEIARSMDFSQIKLIPDNDGVIGFSAFDGLFIVALNTDGNGNVYLIEISTGASYASTLSDDEKFNEALIYASTIIFPLICASSIDKDEISILSGKLLYSENKQVKIAKKDFSENESRYLYCKMNRVSNGGFEIILACAAD